MGFQTAPPPPSGRPQCLRLRAVIGQKEMWLPPEWVQLSKWPSVLSQLANMLINADRAFSPHRRQIREAVGMGREAAVGTVQFAKSRRGERFYRREKCCSRNDPIKASSTFWDSEFSSESSAFKSFFWSWLFILQLSEVSSLDQWSKPIDGQESITFNLLFTALLVK